MRPAAKKFRLMADAPAGALMRPACARQKGASGKGRSANGPKLQAQTPGIAPREKFYR